MTRGHLKICHALLPSVLVALSACKKTDTAQSIIPPVQTDVCQAVRETPPDQMKTFWLGLPYKGYERVRVEHYDYDYKFSLPQAYFNHRAGAAIASRTGKSDGAILFYARYPDFAPYNLKISEADYYSDEVKALGHRNWTNPEISIVLGGWNLDPNISPADWLKPENVRRLKWRFRRKESSPVGWDIDEVPTALAEGLLELDPDMKYARSQLYRNDRFFIHRDEEGVATDLIVCGLENFEKSFCQHTSDRNDLLLRLSYRSAFLKDWRQIKNNVIALSECMTVAKERRPDVLPR